MCKLQVLTGPTPCVERLDWDVREVPRVAPRVVRVQ